MKIIISSFVVLLLMTSCRKDNFNYPKDTVGSSKIIYFATFSMAGSPYSSIVQGDNYTDPGATATQNGTELPVTVTGAVDATKAGIYTITYSAVNTDGFPASVKRVVAVLPSAELPGVDLSGSYFYVGTGANDAKITKLAPGFYSSENCFGNLLTLPCLFFCMDGGHLIIPPQPTPYGEMYGTGTLSSTGALTYLITIESQGLFGYPTDWQRKQ